MLEFMIPTVKDDLLKSIPGQFFVEEVLTSRLIPIKLQDAKANLLSTDGLSIEKYFEIFYSILCRFNELDIAVKKLAWSVLLKVSERFCSTLHKALENDSTVAPIWESSDRINYLNSLKMIIYLLVQMSDMYQSSARQSAISSRGLSPKKGKKKVKSKDNADQLGMNWEDECTKSFQLLMNYVDLDIHRLWPTQLVEDEFTSLISNFCYKVLEDPTIIKNKILKSNVLHLLGCLIKKHNQSLSASLKIVQMMQHFEHISSPLAEAMQLWVSTYKCRSLMPEILRELSNIEEKELIRDSVSTRTICCFIQDLAKLLPAEILPHVSLLMSRMDEESYPMRNAVLAVFAEILIQCLNGENLSEKSKADRDQFLDILHDHANLDVNAFVRSKAVQIITNLVKSEVLPIKRCSKVADLGIRLLLDKSNLVRKAAVQLLESLLRWNPFAATLSIDVLKDGLDDAKKKMQELTLKQGETEADCNGVTETLNKSEESANPDEEKDCEQPSSIVEIDTAKEDATESDDSETAKLKKVFTYLSDAVEFVEKFHEAVSVLCHLLSSKTQSDVLEAINFFTTAWEFKLSFAVEGITGMLDQIWNEDQKIRDAVVAAYKEFYFKLSNKSSNQVQQIVDNMMVLAANSTKEKLEAFEALIVEMKKSGGFMNGVTQLLWDRFVDPPSSFTMERGISEAKQRKVAVQLLGMLGNCDPTILTSKIGVLVNVGLTEEKVVGHATHDSVDFELAMHTCVTLLKLTKRNSTAGIYKKQFRLLNDHKIFTNITNLLVNGFTKPSTSWVVFAFEATSVLFQLAAGPADLSKSIFEQLFLKLNEHYYSEDTPGETIDRLLSRFFAISGHFALKFLIFVDGDVQSEMKRRRKLEEEKEESAVKKKKSKRKSKNLNRSKTDNLEEEMGVGGATADDADQEVIKNVLESEIVASDTMLGSVTELIVRSCTIEVPPEDHRAVQVQLSASLALSKYMLVSSEFCEKHMRLFFTMLQSSPHEGVRANLTIAAGDLCVRFPNLMEPWTSNIYARLNDQSTMVRIYAIKVLTNLILHDMIKVKGHVSEMAKCIADEDTQIAMLAKRFFQELSKKGNSVYNVMPDIISRLSDPDVGLKDDVDFKSIMRFLFDFIQKDKQSESLVEKLCHRFKATRNLQQWRDLAFCLSLLNYSEKAIKKLIENFSFYANTLRDEQVYYSFDAVISKSKKFAKPELKIQIDELEGKIIDHHTEGASEDESSARAAEASRRHKLSRPHSVSQAPPETPKKKFTLMRSLSVSCEKLSLKDRLPPLPASVPRKRTSVPVASSDSSKKKTRYFGNKRNMAFNHTRSQKKERNGQFEEKVTGIPRRTTRRKPVVVNFSDDDDDDDNDDEFDVDDSKENLNVQDENDENLNHSLASNISTPIRRKKTPKRSISKPALRA